MNEQDPLLEELTQASREVYAAVDLVEDQIAKMLGIHRSDLRCLNILENGPQSASEIGRRANLTSGSVTALVDRLERVGLVERHRSSTDRRSVLVNIPDRSYPRVDALYSQVGRAIKESFQSADPAGLQVATEVLRTFAAACHNAQNRIEESKTPTDQ
ncbi:MarR family transcriptional regulator [Pelagibius litoralis]|uniref:MarR family transcriptional regulator n=1 Tax=Pelagibius litoralis TaxID=374515 RepID=A0A967EXU0_9PROT|nr:MarR family transcriptional regulator [Pelagibius litoralis]NIA69396.1 MarR family transcriptional regulator [Pelagibius litoralis]